MRPFCCGARGARRPAAAPARLAADSESTPTAAAAPLERRDSRSSSGATRAGNRVLNCSAFLASVGRRRARAVSSRRPRCGRLWPAARPARVTLGQRARGQAVQHNRRGHRQSAALTIVLIPGMPSRRRAPRRRSRRGREGRTSPRLAIVAALERVPSVAIATGSTRTAVRLSSAGCAEAVAQLAGRRRAPRRELGSGWSRRAAVAGQANGNQELDDVRQAPEVAAGRLGDAVEPVVRGVDVDEQVRGGGLDVEVRGGVRQEGARERGAVRAVLGDEAIDPRRDQAPRDGVARGR